MASKLYAYYELINIDMSISVNKFYIPNFTMGENKDKQMTVNVSPSLHRFYSPESAYLSKSYIRKEIFHWGCSIITSCLGGG